MEDDETDRGEGFDMGLGGWTADDFEFGFTELAEAIERLIAAMAAFLLADVSFAGPRILASALSDFGGVCVFAALQM